MTKFTTTALALLTLAYVVPASAQMMAVERDEPTAAAKAVGGASVTGKIVAIDTTKRTLNLEDGKTYVVAPGQDIATLKTGDKVKVDYSIVATFNVVQAISVAN